MTRFRQSFNFMTGASAGPRVQRDPVLVSIVVCAVGIASLVSALGYLAGRSADAAAKACAEKGGVRVKVDSGFACIKAERITT